jgi:hypothetical protein
MIMEIKIDKKDKEIIYTFDKIPTVDEDITGIEEYLKEPSFAPAFLALTMCGYKTNKEFCFKVLDILNGPKDINGFDRSYYEDRFMDGKYYKPYSYFDGATPENNYTPDEPYVVHVYEDPNGIKDEGYKSFLMKSSGSDSKRKVTVRLKPSISSWFIVDEMLFADIRIPKKDDDWA